MRSTLKAKRRHGDKLPAAGVISKGPRAHPVMVAGPQRSEDSHAGHAEVATMVGAVSPPSAKQNQLLESSATTRAFSYEMLNATLAAELQEIAERIYVRRRRFAQDIFETGQDLIRAKAALPHGKFGHWIRMIGMSWSSAHSAMCVAKEFKDKFATVANLSPKFLYQLAAPSTSPQVRDAAVAILESGAASASDEIRQLIRSQRPKKGKRTCDNGLNDPSRDCLPPGAQPEMPTIAPLAIEEPTPETIAGAPLENSCFVGDLSDEPRGMPKGCWTLDALVGPTIVRIAEAMTSDPVAADEKAALLLELIKKGVRAVIELVNDQPSAALPLTAEQRGTINAGSIALAVVICEDVD